MEFVRESAEHHFLTILDKLKRDPKNWMGLHFNLSRNLDHTNLVKDLKSLRAKIEKEQAFREDLAKNLMKKLENLETGYLYAFPDNDIVLLAKAQNKKDYEVFHGIRETLASEIRKNCSSVSLMADDLRTYQKLANDKLLSSKRLSAYNTMSDQFKTASIPVRRTQRDNPVVMVVEDDRFTASYTSNILNRDYDVVVCRNGEDAIQSYIEEAPDIVFLDIHLPGLSGHETLEAIHAVDPDPYVVMLSVDTAKPNIVKASENGAQKFLKKPFSKERILSITKMSPYIYMRNMRMRTETIVN